MNADSVKKKPFQMPAEIRDAMSKPRKMRPMVNPDGTMEVVFAQPKMGIIVDDVAGEDGVGKVVVTQVRENGALAGAKVGWTVVAVNGVGLEELGIAGHYHLQAYIASIPIRPMSLTLLSPPRPPSRHELEEMAEKREVTEGFDLAAPNP